MRHYTSSKLDTLSISNEGNPIKVIQSHDDFEDSWKEYQRKGSKQKALKYWKRLSQSDRDEIKARIPSYVTSTPDLTYRKNFEGWINPANKLWRNLTSDELKKIRPASQTQEIAAPPKGWRADRDELCTRNAGSWNAKVLAATQDADDFYALKLTIQEMIIAGIEIL